MAKTSPAQNMQYANKSVQIEVLNKSHRSKNICTELYFQLCCVRFYVVEIKDFKTFNISSSWPLSWPPGKKEIGAKCFALSLESGFYIERKGI